MRRETQMAFDENSAMNCDNCGNEIDEDNMTIPLDSSSPHCEYCVDYCDYCGDGFMDIGYHVHAGCNECGHSICPESSYYYCDNCDDYQCEDCGDCNYCASYNRPSGIRRYHDNPTLIFHGTGNVFLGVEIEFDNSPDEICDTVKSFDDSEHYVWLCEDGSIDGAEIISHPMTLDAVRQFPFDSMLRALRHTSARATDGTGIHVHIGRESFKRNGRHSQAHVARWLKFLYSNKDGCELVARRDSMQWAEFVEFGKYGYKGHSATLGDKARRTRTCDNRYQAVNTTNSATYEVRIFRSTFDYQEFMGCVEFVHATVEYTRNRANGLGDAMRWESFNQWLTDNAAAYPSLVALVAASGVL